MLRFSTIRPAVLLALSIAGPNALHAQNPSVLTLLDPGRRQLTVGATSNGALGTGDWQSARGSIVQAWALDLVAGSTVSVDLISSAFDAYLYMTGPGINGALADDDSGGGCHARITHTSATGGSYRVIASSLGSGETGEFTLVVSERPGPAASEGCVGDGATTDVTAEALMGLAPQDRLTVGQNRVGVLDQTHQVNDRLVAAWDLQGEAGQSVVVDLVSSEFDAYLFLAGPGLPLRTDDDTGGACNARVEITFPETGTYRVGASSFGSGAGRYTIMILEDTPPEYTGACPGSTPPDATELLALPFDGRRLSVGTEVVGQLDANADAEFNGAASQAWGLEAAAGDQFTIDLISEDFDAYLYLAGPGIEAYDVNDDGGGACHSRITHTATEAGTFHIVASSISSSEGSYILRASSTPGPENPESCGAGDLMGDVEDALAGLDPGNRRLAPGEPSPGQLTADDDVDGRPLQAWALAAGAGDSFQIDLESDIFDAYLYVTGPGIASALTDDDSGEGFNSRLTLRAAEAGIYHVVVSALGANAEGAFVLRVARN